MNVILLACSAKRSELAAVMRRVEVAVGMSQAVCNRSRLLKFAGDLSARLGSTALSSSLAKILLHAEIVSCAEPQTYYLQCTTL